MLSEHFKGVFSYATMGILIADARGRIVAVNPFALKEFGYTENELVGQPVEMLVPDRHKEKHITHHQKFVEHQKARLMGTDLELFALRKDGTEIPVEISLGSYQSNNEVFVVAFVNNISARKNAAAKIKLLQNNLEETVVQRTRDLQEALQKLEISEKELQRSVAFQKALLQNAGAIIISVNAEGIIQTFNPQAEKELGYRAEDVIGRHTPLIFNDPAEVSSMANELSLELHKNILPGMEVFLAKSKLGLHSEMECTCIRKDGSRFPILLNVTALKDAQDTVTGFIGISVNISERKRIERELKGVKQLFFQLLKNYPDGTISIIDKNFNFVYTGGELHTLLGADPDKLIGNRIFPKFPEELRRIILKMLGNVFKQKSVYAGFELPSPLTGNSYVMDAFPLVEEDGAVDNAGVIIRNISELIKAKDDLQKALENEKELSELKSRFVSMASHEFRTPLSTVLSSAYLIGKYSQTEDQPKRERHLQHIISSVNMLTDILNDFLSVGKIEEGKIQVRPALINVKEQVEELAGELKNIMKKEQTINCRHDGNEEVVMMDKSLLKHIVMNLVSNASKFSPDGSTVEIKTTVGNGHFVLSVKDYGIGISKEDQKHLMERFFRGANAGNIQGTGLGLHIIAKYAELMNGTVQYKSELDKGTEFIITFNTKNGIK
ncbi:MAG TPA: PAS domain S-box protein [Niabella sp.]|nr:PAS domain S-box protein [Chitinophagaceae bacterium]HRO86033.1 PAS domain S-box protein [Niabella sp.]